MGSFIEVNDTLQITKEQGFPKELDYIKHQERPFTAKDFESKVFEFKGKPDKRIYHSPPVRIFFAENINGKWLYWGLIHMLEVTVDQVKNETSGIYKIVKIYSPEEMKIAPGIVHPDEETSYF